MDTLALGYVIPAIRVHAVLAPSDNAHAVHTEKNDRQKILSVVLIVNAFASAYSIILRTVQI